MLLSFDLVVRLIFDKILFFFFVQYFSIRFLRGTPDLFSLLYVASRGSEMQVQLLDALFRISR